MQLQNHRLKLEISEPGTLYLGSRFDWSGFITQVTLDGKHTFCSPESLEKGVGTGGRGLCNEFGIFQPVGYNSARPGDWFPKLGVGLLRRADEEPYDFARPYECQLFPLEVQSGDQELIFQFEPLPCRGYEAHLKKTLRLRDNTLELHYDLENVGSEPIFTHEYVHNFIALNGAAPSPAYQLRLRDGFQLRDAGAFLRQSGRQIRWNRAVKDAQIWEIDTNLSATQGMTEPVWQLSHDSEKIGLSESLDVAVARMALWCAPHVLSPEVFVDISIAPGQNLSWTRRYQFTEQTES